MTKRRNVKAHSSAGAFVFLLLGVFGVFAAFMVILSVQLYRTTVVNGETQNEQRILSNYFINIIHTGDAAGTVSVREDSAGKMLVISWPDEPWDDDDIADDEEEPEAPADPADDAPEEASEEESDDDWDTDYVYETFVYCYDGQIYELLKTSNEAFVPGNGEAICGAEAFEPVVENGMATIHVTDTDGAAHTCHVRLYSEGKKAAE